MVPLADVSVECAVAMPFPCRMLQKDDEDEEGGLTWPGCHTRSSHLVARGGGAENGIMETMVTKGADGNEELLVLCVFFNCPNDPSCAV